MLHLININSGFISQGRKRVLAYFWLIVSTLSQHNRRVLAIAGSIIYANDHWIDKSTSSYDNIAGEADVPLVLLIVLTKHNDISIHSRNGKK